MNFLESMFGKIGPDMCKLSMSGNIAVKTSSGYKTYNVKTNKLTNCNNFVFNMGDMDCFFLIPTNKVQRGDIIIANGKPKCVISVEDDKSITCINYETAVVETILPERHVFMGNTYFYGKIVSMFGDNLKKNGSEKIFKYMMMSEMMKGTNNSNNSNNMLPMMMMMNGNSFFDDIFDGFNTDTTDSDEETSEKETEE